MTSSMDLALFLEQLNLVLQTTDKNSVQFDVCNLFNIHTKGGIRLTQGHRVLVEILEENNEDAKKQELSLPILMGEAELGKLIVLRTASPFTTDELVLARIVQAVCTLTLRRKFETDADYHKSRVDLVRGVINTLSFSELEAAIYIAKHIPEGEGLVVAGKISDKLGFTRSVVTGALRKLESAGTIETRSLGMKGTYIRIKDSLLVEELRKL